MVGLRNLRNAESLGRGVLVLPLHIGPSYTIGPVVGHHIGCTLVFNRMNFDEIKEVAFPTLDVEAFQLGSRSTFRAGIDALRSQRAFTMFHEVDPRGIDQHHERVPFLGTTVMAPLGPVLMSRVVGAPMLPVVMRAADPGRFTLTYFPPISPSKSSQDDANVLKELWQVIEAEVSTGAVGEWEIWHEFDRLKPKVDGLS